MDFNALIEVIERYAVKIGSASFSWVSFIWCCIFLLIIFTIKTLILIKMNKRDKNKKKQLYVGYIIGYESCCWLFASIIAVVMICVVGNIENIIFNYIIAPTAGFIAHFWFDARVMTEVSPDFHNGLTKRSQKKSGDSGSNSNNIVVNVNAVNDERKENPINSLSDSDIEKLGKHITEDELNEDSETVFLEAINVLKDNQCILSKELKRNAEMMCEQSDALDAITHSMMTDKKLELERDINECLNQGYAKPDQNKKITANYLSYTKLHGNGEIKELYENHYLKLEVHEDKRKKSRDDIYGELYERCMRDAFNLKMYKENYISDTPNNDNIDD